MTLVLTEKAKKLMKLCEVEGYNGPYELLQAVADDSVCPAICMTGGCDRFDLDREIWLCQCRHPDQGAGILPPKNFARIGT
jgi:hypothetical protein